MSASPQALNADVLHFNRKQANAIRAGLKLLQHTLWATQRANIALDNKELLRVVRSSGTRGGLLNEVEIDELCEMLDAH